MEQKSSILTKGIELFKSLLGDEAVIIIEHVNEVPVLRSGKRKHVACHYKPKGEGGL